jgi:hypothetical protein
MHFFVKLVSPGQCLHIIATVTEERKAFNVTFMRNNVLIPLALSVAGSVSLFVYVNVLLTVKVYSAF